MPQVRGEAAIRGALLIVSSLLYIEAPQCWRRLYKRRVISPNEVGGNVAADRVAAFRKADAALDTFLSGFECREATITKGLMQAASDMVARFDLNAHDALVAALARDLAISHIASLDRDFRRIDGIELWDGLLVR